MGQFGWSFLQPSYYFYFVANCFFLHQNDVSEIPDLTFSMDADEEKQILYEKTEVSLILSSK